MPIVNFHLTDTETNRANGAALLREACALYAEVLKAPVERIRAFVTLHPEQLFLAAGQLCNDNGVNAPFFECYVLDGRPVEDRQRLLKGFTDLIVQHLGVEARIVRGCCIRVDPQDWGIAGVPASEVRKAEVEARAKAASETSQPTGE